jgi:plasmid stability protein
MRFLDILTIRWNIGRMIRTTIGFDDDLLRQLKQRAAKEGVTLQELVNDLLRQSLATAKRAKYELKLKGWNGAVLPGVDLTDRDKLFDLMGGR